MHGANRLNEAGLSDFNALQNRRNDGWASLLAFDVLEIDGDDLRDQPLIERRERLASFWRGAMMAFNSSSICKATVQRYSRTLVALAWKASFLSVQILPTEQDHRGCGSRSKTVITRPLSGSRPPSRRENFGGGNSHRLHEPSARKQHRVSSQKAHTAPAEVLKTGVTGEREIERVNVGDDTKLPPTPWPGLWFREVVLGRGGMRAAVIIATGLGLALLQPRRGSTAY